MIIFRTVQSIFIYLLLVSSIYLISNTWQSIFILFSYMNIIIVRLQHSWYFDIWLSFGEYLQHCTKHFDILFSYRYNQCEATTKQLHWYLPYWSCISIWLVPSSPIKKKKDLCHSYCFSVKHTSSAISFRSVHGLQMPNQCININLRNLNVWVKCGRQISFGST